MYVVCCCCCFFYLFVSISTEFICSTMILLSIFIVIVLGSLSSRLPFSASFSSLSGILSVNLESVPLSHFSFLCLFQRKQNRSIMSPFLRWFCVENVIRAPLAQSLLVTRVRYSTGVSCVSSVCPSVLLCWRLM